MGGSWGKAKTMKNNIYILLNPGGIGQGGMYMNPCASILRRVHAMLETSAPMHIALKN